MDRVLWEALFAGVEEYPVLTGEERSTMRATALLFRVSDTPVSERKPTIIVLEQSMTPDVFQTNNRLSYDPVSTRKLREKQPTKGLRPRLSRPCLSGFCWLFTSSVDCSLFSHPCGRILLLFLLISRILLGVTDLLPAVSSLASHHSLLPASGGGNHACNPLFPPGCYGIEPNNCDGLIAAVDHYQR